MSVYISPLRFLSLSVQSKTAGEGGGMEREREIESTPWMPQIETKSDFSALRPNREQRSIKKQ